MNAASSYVGSLWGGWGKKATEKKENNENEAMEANDSRKGSMTGGLGMMSSAFGRLSSFSKTSPVDHDQKTEAENSYHRRRQEICAEIVYDLQQNPAKSIE